MIDTPVRDAFDPALRAVRLQAENPVLTIAKARSTSLPRLVLSGSESRADMDQT